MPLMQRSSGSVGRETPTSSLHGGRDDGERLVEALTKLNQVMSQRDSLLAETDRLKANNDAVNRKLSESNKTVYDLKAQADSFKQEHIRLRESYKQVVEDNNRNAFDKQTWEQHYDELRAQYKQLEAQYEVLSRGYGATGGPSVSNPMMSKLPERPKTSKSSSKRDHHKESHREERGRGRDREKKEAKAEKDRLSRRFEGKNRPGSYIEGFGSKSGRSSSMAPIATRTLANQAIYSNVPRTSGMPLDPTLYSGSGGAVYYDEQEDGNYHKYPIR